MRNKSRRQLLKDIIEFGVCYKSAIKEVSKLPYDFDGTLVTLTIDDIENALKKINSGYSFQEITEWAEFFEIREDVEFDKSVEPLIQKLIFLLANPEISGQTEREIYLELTGEIQAIR